MEVWGYEGIEIWRYGYGGMKVWVWGYRGMEKRNALFIVGQYSTYSTYFVCYKHTAYNNPFQV
jgi:hypothetical protein